MLDTIVYAITDSASLRVLNLGNNPIGDDGIFVIMESLQTNSTLTELNMNSCGLSAKGTIYIYIIS